jgi:hypothetical protein
MAINTDTPDVRPPTAEDMANNGFAAPPSEDFAAGSAPKPEYSPAEDAFKAEGPGDEMEDFASKARETPGRYDSDYIKDITGQIDAELEQKKLYAGTELDEFMSQRGMVGSSVEGELRKSMLGDMERQRQERLNELNTRAADAWAEDRSGAADIGFKSAEFQRSLGGDKENAARYEAEFGQSQYEFDKTYGQGAWGNRIEEKRLELMEKGMDQDEAYRMAMADIQKEQFAETIGEERAARVQRYGLDMGALENETRRIENEETGLSMQEVRDQAEINLRLEQLQAQKEEAGEAFEIDRERIRIQNDQFRDGLGLEQLKYEEQRAARIATIGMESRALDQSAERLQLDALVQGRDMDLREARNLAEMEFRTLELSKTMGLEQARLQAEDDQFQALHKQNAAQWADSLGMDQAQYEEAVATRKAEYGDRSNARLAQMNLQEGSLEHEAMQNSLNRTLEREAVTLQERGLDEETAWRLADRLQQERLEEKALDIQENGIGADTAWREALNESNERMQEAQISSEKALTNLGIGANAARDLTRESHEAAMNAANISSTENIEGLARLLQQSGIDAETAWRAASDAAQEAMTNANNSARANLQAALLESDTTLQASRISSAEKMQTLGVGADTARDTARSIHETAINAASLTNAEDIAALNNAAQITLQTALLNSNETISAARNTSAETLQTLGLGSAEAIASARNVSDAAINAASLVSAADIASANNTARNTLETSLLEKGIGAATAAATAKETVDETFASARETAATTVASTKATVDETFADARASDATAAATANETHQKAIDSANNSSRETIQTSVRNTVGDQLTAEEGWRTSQRDHEEAMQILDRALVSRELTDKAWGSDEDRRIREWEFSNANNTQRLGMILSALASDEVDSTEAEDWRTKYPTTGAKAADQAALATLQAAISASLARERALQDEIDRLNASITPTVPGG